MNDDTTTECPISDDTVPDCAETIRELDIFLDGEISDEELGALSVPALVVGGEKSPANFRYGNEALLRCLPKTTPVAMIPGAHLNGTR